MILVERTASSCTERTYVMQDLQQAELGQRYLLVGGSTRIPAVQDKVKQLTGKEP